MYGATCTLVLLPSMELGPGILFVYPSPILFFSYFFCFCLCFFFEEASSNPDVKKIKGEKGSRNARTVLSTWAKTHIAATEKKGGQCCGSAYFHADPQFRIRLFTLIRIQILPYISCDKDESLLG
jgi:hypothetical protein